MIRKIISLGIATAMTIMFMSVPSFAGKVLLKVPVWFPTTLPALGTSPIATTFFWFNIRFIH